MVSGESITEEAIKIKMAAILVKTVVKVIWKSMSEFRLDIDRCHFLE